jgi:hypothetical protein
MRSKVKRNEESSWGKTKKHQKSEVQNQLRELKRM